MYALNIFWINNFTKNKKMIKQKIINKIIKNKKPISVELYTELCLYDKEGYYKKKDIIGKQGDFVTSPEISQLFGEILGLFIYLIWKNKINREFNLIELGPGRGTLLLDILNITKTFYDFRNLMDVKLIEKNSNLINSQKINFKEKKINLQNLKWLKNFTINNKKPSIIFANEFFDCLPIRQFYKKNEKWYEKMINYNKELRDFNNEDLEIVDKKTLSLISKNNPKNLLEFSKSRDNYIKNLCDHLKKFGGVMIIIDYGYFDKPTNFTLQAIYNNKKSHIFSNPGEQDITSLVDFKRIIEIIKVYSFKIDIFSTQRDFLIMNGINERLKKITNHLSQSKKKLMENGVERLIHQKNMGTLFKVLVVTNIK